MYGATAATSVVDGSACDVEGSARSAVAPNSDAADAGVPGSITTVTTVTTGSAAAAGRVRLSVKVGRTTVTRGATSTGISAGGLRSTTARRDDLGTRACRLLIPRGTNATTQRRYR